MAMARFLDWIFVIYFASHIPISIFIDFQAVLPKSVYPQVSRDTLSWYCHKFKDPMMLDPPAWFHSFCIAELFVQFPFFPVALYAFYKGYKWIRIPAIVYGAHVATTVWAILWHIWFHDFSGSPYPSPETTQDKLMLSAFYLPYFICPVLLVLKCGFAEEYTRRAKTKSN